MEEKLKKLGWKHWCTLSGTECYFKNGMFIVFSEGKIINFWRTTIFYKISEEKHEE